MRATMLPSSWAASTLVHASAFGALALGAHRAEVRPVRAEAVEIRIDAVAPAPEPPPKAPLEEPAPVPVRAPARAPQRANAPAKTAPVPAPDSAPAPAPNEPPEAPLDLTAGAPLGDHGTFASAAGSGGGSGRGTVSPSGAHVGVAPPPPAGPRIVGRDELSRPPAPPDLSARLLAAYPARARAAGESGTAVLSLVVLADGSTTAIVVRTATSAELGRACVETVRGARWQPPLDKSGSPIATRVGYTCTFDVR